MRFFEVVTVLEDCLKLLDDAAEFSSMEDRIVAAIDSVFAVRQNVADILEFLNQQEIEAIFSKECWVRIPR